MSPRACPIIANVPYHITARCINREWFEIPKHEVWDIMERYLYFLNKSFDMKIYAFVLMPNHFHLIAKVVERNLSESMNYFMRETSRNIGFRADRINQVYGQRYHKTLIKSSLYFSHAYKYVYRNPVKAKLVEKVEDYPYSTLYGLLGLRRILIPIEEDTQLFNPEFEERSLAWLNAHPLQTDDQIVRAALRRKVFALPKDKPNRKQHRLIIERF